jgi:hypothetical protein
MGITVNIPIWITGLPNLNNYVQVADVMPLKQFDLIRHNIRFVDNANLKEDNIYQEATIIKNKEKMPRDGRKVEVRTYSNHEMTIP